MNRKISSLLFLASLALIACPAIAQSGCVNSPECPTALLAVIGAAGDSLIHRFKR